jgi:hypothetical protein
LTFGAPALHRDIWGWFPQSRFVIPEARLGFVISEDVPPLSVCVEKGKGLGSDSSSLFIKQDTLHDGADREVMASFVDKEKGNQGKPTGSKRRGRKSNR